MKKKLAIVGGGTAGMFLAAFINTELYDVTIFEKKATLGRKFLVAGDGGFNLTHVEELANFKTNYLPSAFFDKALDHFSNEDLRTWLSSIGIPTFVGSSGKIFPEKGIKPIEVLKSIESFLIKKSVKFQFNKSFTGWNEHESLIINSKEIIEADFVVFALGGSSWKVTGSDGSWLKLFEEKNIQIQPFQPANCAYQINWPEKFIKKHEGQPIKNLSISMNKQIQKGELVITKFGIEGNAIYGLSNQIQASFNKLNEATVHLDLKPTTELTTLIKKLKDSESNTSVTLREEIKLSKASVDLIKINSSKEDFLNPSSLAGLIKNLPLKLTAAATLDEAISTTGGISLEAISSSFELKALAQQYCIGEMLDWNAPTGGYLIQACASMGVYLAHQLNNKVS